MLIKLINLMLIVSAIKVFFFFNVVLWNGILSFHSSDYLSSELQAIRMTGGDEDKMEIDEEVYF